MNKKYSLLAVTLALVAVATVGSTQYSFAAWPFGDDTPKMDQTGAEVSTPEVRAVGGISDDVWQESCNPVIILKDTTSCQQANVIIQQQHKMIMLMESIVGEQ